MSRKLLKGTLIYVLTVSLLMLYQMPVFSWGTGATEGHLKQTRDAFNDSRASAFKSAMEAEGKTATLEKYVVDQDLNSEQNWVAWLDDPGNPDAGVPLDIMEKAENINMVPHGSIGAIPTNLELDPRLHNARELLRNAIYWSYESTASDHNELAYRCLGDGLHLIQDTFAHMNNGRIDGTPHALGYNYVDDDGNGTKETLVGDVMDDPNWDNHNDDSAELRVSDAYNMSYWHKHTDFAASYRFDQSVETSIKYMNAFVSGSVADFDKALQLGYTQNGNTASKYYIDYINKVVVDNNDALCTFDGNGAWTSGTLAGYWGTNIVQDGTSGADSSNRWAKFSTPDAPTYAEDDTNTWYSFQPGKYKIYMRWTAHTNRPDAAPLEIKYNGSIDTTKTVNQQVNGGQWNLIGTYDLAATGNYVKILATDSGYTVADAVMFVKAPGNYPISSITSSSSHEGTGWSAPFINDQQRSSMLSSLGWSSESSLTTNHTEWVKADLGSSKTVSRVDLFPRNDSGKVGAGFPIDFTISISNDNVNWTTVVTNTNYAQPGNTVQSFSFSSQSARYIKVTGTNLGTVNGSYRMQFAEMEIY